MTFPDDQRPHRPRTVSHVNRDVGLIIQETLGHFDKWRDRVAMLQASVERKGADRKAIRKECTSIRAGILQARTNLILGLAESPARMSGHGRVVDVERALDSLEESLTQIEAKTSA
jgi:hypothetical protein